MKKIGIVGVGGRTGTLFAEELSTSSTVVSICSKNKAELIKNGLLFVSRDGKLIPIQVDPITEDEIKEEDNFDFLFFTTKNPVSPILRRYLTKFKSRIPDIILSQNGFVAGEEAREVIEEQFGEVRSNFRIIRLVLFNAVEEEEDKNRLIISYKLPIRIAFSVYYGEEKTDDLEEIFKNANFEYTVVEKMYVKHMEYSKLFTNIVGLASYSNNFNIFDGFRDAKSFKMEILSLKEYINVVEKSGSGFINFPHYPIKTFATIIKYVPLWLLLPLRGFIARLILKLRGNVKKGNIDEIDYYIGKVVEMGKANGVKTETLEKVLRRLKHE